MTWTSRRAAIVRRGKGGTARTVPIGRAPAARSTGTCVPAACTGWPTPPRCGSATAARRSPTRAAVTRSADRAPLAGIRGFHPHVLRHTAADRWLSAGGSEGGLMAVAGWTRPDMLMRYTRARAEQRAADEARKLNLGDL